MVYDELGERVTLEEVAQGYRATQHAFWREFGDREATSLLRTVHAAIERDRPDAFRHCTDSQGDIIGRSVDGVIVTCRALK